MLKISDAEKILQKLNINFVSINEPKSGYRNQSFEFLTREGKRNLFFYKVENNILQNIINANEIGQALHSAGFECRNSLSNIYSINLKDNSKKYFCIYNYCDGETIPWESYTSKHIKLLGGKMGKMHTLLENSDLNLTNYEQCLDILENQLEEMQKYFLREDVLTAIQTKLRIKIHVDFKKLETILTKLRLQKFQIIHMDFVRGNILFQEKENLEISGVLDFEKVSVGPKILDVARTLAFLIIDCKYMQEEKIRKYFLINGYKKRGQNNLGSIEFLEDLISYFLFYDFYKFLKHNPYEFLELNEHFCKTRDKLISQTILKSLRTQ